MIVPVLQALSGLSWLAVAMLLVPRAWRLLFKGEDNPQNARAVMIVYIALVQFGFSLRWWIFDHALRVMSVTELVMWSGLYILNGLGAGMIFAVVWRQRFDV